ncbi:hypothetical protein BJ170DRAFT_626076 [Xylariales sp. AK1849]|nr:hypothetical protein BJ170DRAFT_626076 [Xylariales sp. AK1849]
MVPPPGKQISVVLVGVTRDTATNTADTYFGGTPYQLSAALDQTESPEEYQYSVINLSIVLNAVYPHPQVLITGTAIPDDLLPGIHEAWEAYVRKWHIDGVWVALSKTHPSTGPPPPGTGEEMMRQLKEKFGV